MSLVRLTYVNSDNPTVELDGARAFEDFFQKSHRRVLGLAFVLSGRIEVAEELTHEGPARRSPARSTGRTHDESTSPYGTPIIEYPDGSNPTADLVCLVCTSAPISSRPPVGGSCEFEAPRGGPRRADPYEGMTILFDLGDAVAVVFENGFGETAVVYPANGVAMLNWPYRTLRVTVHEANGTTTVVDR